MARRLILDTGVLIAAERSRLALDLVVGADDDVVLAAVSVAELYAGIALADERFRQQRSDFVDRVLEIIPVELYDTSIAQVHGRLLAHAHKTGRPRGAHDLIIAATAIAKRRTIVTTDRGANFGDLPEVDSVELR